MQARQLKVLTAAVKDVDQALDTFRKNFGFALTRRGENAASGARSAFLKIGAAEIELATASSGVLGEALERGEGLFQIELEVVDLDAAQREFAARGVSAAFESDAGGRRVLRVDRTHTHGVPLVLSQPA